MTVEPGPICAGDTVVVVRDRSPFNEYFTYHGLGASEMWMLEDDDGVFFYVNPRNAALRWIRKVEKPA